VSHAGSIPVRSTALFAYKKAREMMIAVPKPKKRVKNKTKMSHGMRVGMLKRSYGLESIPHNVLKGEHGRVIELICDDIWSRAIKVRDRYKCVPKCLGFQHKCTSVLQSMHIFRRGKKKLRQNLSNGLCGCSGAHVYFTHNEDEFHDLLRLRMPELMDQLQLIKQTATHHYRQDLNLIYVYLCTEYNNLKKGRGLRTYEL
jgi:hypothetical protein